MARSRTSGQQTEAEKATWRRRRGNPGGGRTEAEKLGLDVPQPARADPVSDTVLAAFVSADADALRHELGLEVWENTPLVGVPCRAVDHGPAIGACFCNVVDMRRRIIAEIERRGAFRFADVNHEDDTRAGAAWDALGRVAEQAGVDTETWERIRRAAGWEKTEQEASDDRA
jgi:hypothetical protein